MYILILTRFMGIAVVIALIFIFLTQVLRKKLIVDRELNRPFECGFSTAEESRFPFSLRFFLVALIFLIFDVELLLLFPYLRTLIFSSGVIRFLVYLLFLSILSLGLFYE